MKKRYPDHDYDWQLMPCTKKRSGIPAMHVPNSTLRTNGTRAHTVSVAALPDGIAIDGRAPDTAYLLYARVAVFLAREEMLQMQYQTSLLLSFSSAIGSVRNQEELLHEINKMLKTVIGFNHTVIGITNDDDTISAFLLDPATGSFNHPEYKEAITFKYASGDGVIEHVIASAMPVVFDLDVLSKAIPLPLYLRVNYETGIRQAVMAKFCKGGQVCGIWLLLFEQQQEIPESTLHFIAGLANQLSIAVSNIVANNKINDQLIEINNYKQQLEDEKLYLQQEIDTNHNYTEIVGDSMSMKRIYHLIETVAPSHSTVLILGETGTGKELIARAIHNNSPRKNKLMVKVNCAALPANLVESELFGHERGSFTGATERRVGKFELANEGTLFLDEIGEMPPDMQVKLLRVLQEREIERIGGKGTIKVNVRIIAATNRDLEEEVAAGRFRRDLYYRLNIFPISLPALRERSEDIPLLAAYFVNRFAREAGKKMDGLSNKVLQDLCNYSWPGNIRELEHLIERSVLLTKGTMLKNVYLPVTQAVAAGSADFAPEEIKTISDAERDHIFKVLKYCNGRVGGKKGAADLLGIPSSTLFSKMKKLGIRRDIIQVGK
ncbi:sigma 54-interacting transcriptional regulator [Deminuibacter soli]|nr:sigma 54-interacting transcriptional regulator [Deminuibacter soli]